MKPMNSVQIALIAGAALRVLSERVLTFAGMFLCAGAFGYALWRADPTVSLTACAFALLVYWPAVRLDRARFITPPQGEQHGDQ